jgi:hypothetical protein
LAGKGWSAMEARTQYLEFAEECDRLATQAETDRQRMVLKDMADAWRRLAGEAEREGTPTNGPVTT